MPNQLLNYKYNTILEVQSSQINYFDRKKTIEHQAVWGIIPTIKIKTVCAGSKLICSYWLG